MGKVVFTKNNDAIIGCGSSLAYTALSNWSHQYMSDHNIEINYQPNGSGAAIKEIKNGTVDFVASEEKMDDNELKSLNLIQFPIMVCGIIPVFNLPPNNELNLTPRLLSMIFMGKIKRWDDSRIIELNPNLILPENKFILVVHRVDGSGSTFVFTKFLSREDSEWKDNIGANFSVRWKTGIGVKGNQGIAAYMGQAGTIGYVDFSTFENTKYLRPINLVIHDQIIKPNRNNIIKAFVSSYDVDNVTIGWPMITVTYIICKRDRNEIINFFKKCTTNPLYIDMASEFGYLPIEVNLERGSQ